MIYKKIRERNHTISDLKLDIVHIRPKKFKRTSSVERTYQVKHMNKQRNKCFQGILSLYSTVWKYCLNLLR